MKRQKKNFYLDESSIKVLDEIKLIYKFKPSFIIDNLLTGLSPNKFLELIENKRKISGVNKDA